MSAVKAHAGTALWNARRVQRGRGRLTPLRAGVVCVVTVGIVVSAATAADAATISVVDGTAVFSAAAGENNVVRAGTRAAPGAPLKVIDSGAPLTAGTGCEQIDASSASCSASSQSSPLSVWAGDGDDRVFVDDSSYRPDVAVHGGAGNDALHVGSSWGTSPVLDGGPGQDTLSVANNGSGTPIMHGGPGDDSVSVIDNGGGLLYGDEGHDRLYYSGRAWYTNPVVRLEGGAGSDSYSFGTLSPSAPGTIVPGRGIDTLDLRSTGGLHGASVDLTGCGRCVEQVVGTARDDTITGDAGPEAILGGDGNDILAGGGGPDFLSGQGGDDTIDSRDGTVDVVRCGAGTDTVLPNRFDLFSRADCEVISWGAPAL